VDTLKAATRLLSCVDVSYLETLDRPKHVNCGWIKCIMGCQHHVTMFCHSSLQFMLGSITSERLLLKRGDDFGLYGVFYCGYRTRVQNLQNEQQNELLNKNAKPFEVFKEALVISWSPGCHGLQCNSYI